MLGRRDNDAAPRSLAAPPPSVGTAVGRFMLGSLLAVAVVVGGGYFALRSVATHEAERATRERVRIEGKLVAAAGLSDGILRRTPAAIARLDDVVLGQILDSSVVRVKLWSEDGQILYSDEPALIGRRFGLAADEHRLFRTGQADAELSDLSRPENEFERPEGKLLEAHVPIRTPDGTQVLFEIYQRFGSVSSDAGRLLRALAPPLLAGLLVLVLVQVPLAWSLAGRLRRGHRDRERLLANAIEAQTQERRRIASDLHDGVVQDLAGVAFGLAPVAEAAERRDDEREASVLHDAIGRLRQGQRDLRTLLVEIHPPSLESAGLEAALHDLLSPLNAQGIATDLHVDDHSTAPSQADALIYRVAREAVRNVQSHSGADSVRMEVTRANGDRTRLVVADDGRGFDAAERERRGEQGHMGLTLLASLVEQAEGRLDVHSTPGQGTTVELEVPTR